LDETYERAFERVKNPPKMNVVVPIVMPVPRVKEDEVYENNNIIDGEQSDAVKDDEQIIATKDNNKMYAIDSATISVSKRLGYNNYKDIGKSRAYMENTSFYSSEPSKLLDMLSTTWEFTNSYFYRVNGANVYVRSLNNIKCINVDDIQKATKYLVNKQPWFRTAEIIILNYITIDKYKNKNNATQQQKQFVVDVYNSALRVEGKNGVPAAITTVQALLESNFGNSAIAVYNLFGIKAKTGDNYVTISTTEFNSNGVQYSTSDNFAVFKNFDEGFRRHNQLLLDLYRPKTDFTINGWADALMAYNLKYSTNPNYSQVVKDLVNEWGLN